MTPMFKKQKQETRSSRRHEAESQRARDGRTAAPATFVRNRTITGSSSHSVESAGESSAHIVSPRVHAHRLAHQRRHVFLLLSGSVLVAALLYACIYQFTAATSIHIANVPEAKAQQTYQDDFEAYYMRHPIERLRFLTNVAQLTSYIQSTNPEVAAITLGPSSQFATTNIEINVRKPITSWTTKGKREYVDENGIAFSRNYYREPKLQIVDKSNLPIVKGHAIASDAFLGFVGRLIGDVHRQGLTVRKVVIPSGATREVDVSLRGVPYHVKSSVDRSAGEQAEDMARVIRYLQRHDLSPSYIDVRVAGKAYYK